MLHEERVPELYWSRRRLPVQYERRAGHPFTYIRLRRAFALLSYILDGFISFLHFFGEKEKELLTPCPFWFIFCDRVSSVSPQESTFRSDLLPEPRVFVKKKKIGKRFHEEETIRHPLRAKPGIRSSINYA